MEEEAIDCIEDQSTNKNMVTKDISDPVDNHEEVVSTTTIKENVSSQKTKENGIDKPTENEQNSCERSDPDENSNLLESKDSSSDDAMNEEASDSQNVDDNSNGSQTNVDDADHSNIAIDPTETVTESDVNGTSSDPPENIDPSQDSLSTEDKNKNLEDSPSADVKKSLTADSESVDKEENEIEESPKECSDDRNVDNVQNEEAGSELTDNIEDKLNNDDSKSLSQDEDENEKNDGIVKIKLRSFASLCDGKGKKISVEKSLTSNGSMSNVFSSEISGVSVGDIVQHGNIVESDESGVMHLKISNVMGGEDCITGFMADDDDDALLPIQIASVTSLLEPLSPEEKTNETSKDTEDSMQLSIIQMDNSSEKPDAGDSFQTIENKDAEKGKSQIIVNILKSPLVVSNKCTMCNKKTVCDFRMVTKTKKDHKAQYLCSATCKRVAVANLPEGHVVEKPRLYFEKLCGMCGKDISSVTKSNVFSWQTREFCNKLCLADHIGEVARSCFFCYNPVRVLFMVKYCVRFGSDVHQFCSNGCLEKYKTNITVCCYCQKNLVNIKKVVSPTNKEYCSDKCLKRAQRRDIGQQHYCEENECTVCNKKLISKYEFINNNISVWLCSDPCLNVYKYVNQVKSVNCCLCARLLNSEDSPKYFFNGCQLRVFCSDSCFSVFVISARKIVTCNYCKVKKYNFDMIHHQPARTDTYYCSVCCLNFIENKLNAVNKSITEPINSNEETNSIKSISGDVPVTENVTTPDLPTVPIVTTTETVTTDAAPAATVTPIKECNMCSKVEPAQFHMVMSDSTLRSFCSYVCATRYKCTFGFQVSGKTGDFTLAKKVPDDVTSNACMSQGTDMNNTAPIREQKDVLSLLKLLDPPMAHNRSTMCRPNNSTKGIQCKPFQFDKEVQTDERDKIILPVPIPVYVPTPMMMYSAKVPVPILIPIPVPVPVFIPTTEKTTADIINSIKDVLEKMPSNPVESELLLMAKEAAHEDTKDDAATAYLKAKLNKGGRGGEVAIDETELEILAALDDTIPIASSDTGDAKKRKLSSNSDSETEESSSKRRRFNGGGAPEETSIEELKTNYGLLAWRQWGARLKEDADEAPKSPLEDLIEMDSETLSRSLILFLKDLKRPDGNNYEVDTVFYLLLGLQKHLFENGSTHCIFLENNFGIFTSYFDDLIRKNWKSFLHSEIKERKCLSGTRITEEMLWEARQLGAHTPHVLLNTLFYFNTKVFKLKTSETHSKLSFSQVNKEWTNSYLGSDLSYNRATVLKYRNDPDNSESYEMNENSSNPLRCPVKLYEFYISKCPESVRNRPNTYYVYPEQSCLPDSPVWFSTVSMELSTLDKMLNRILLVKEVQEALVE